MANQDDIALMAHLMRRAGFGASRDELEARVAKGYDATVEELLHPESQPPVDQEYCCRSVTLIDGHDARSWLIGDTAVFELCE